MRKPIPVGSHLVTPRLGYSHHGIYVGRSKVVHYSGLADGLSTGPVEIVSLDAFQAGRSLAIRLHHSPKFSAKEVVFRAHLRVGETRYSLALNNCEHFCEWCINDFHHSHQIDRAIAGIGTTSSLAFMGIRGGLAPFLQVLSATALPFPPLAAVGAVLVAAYGAHQLLSTRNYCERKV